jgi:hypothetical protein
MLVVLLVHDLQVSPSKAHTAYEVQTGNLLKIDTLRPTPRFDNPT